jgi:NAD(P)-dependent dehydrogenase (short-subunit alcohol dehydrogenase family)
MTSALDLFRLDGKVAVITGASSGLGVHFAAALGDAGATVFLAARRADRLAENVDLLRARGIDAHAVTCDVSAPGSCQAAVATAAEHNGRVDVLVNNAGAATAVPASRESPAAFERIVTVNLHGAYWMAQAAAPAMTQGGSIINLSSVLALKSAGLPQAAYSASKAALLGLTRDLAVQWTARKGIRVNALVPGYFPSEMTDAFPPGYLENIADRVPAGRLGRPEELAASLLWLASPASGYVTGQSIVVDGGFLIN